MNDKQSPILICDDDETSLMRLQFSLKNLGHISQSVTSGKDALKKLAEKNPPNMLILDWEMPNLNGIEVCKKVKKSNSILPYVIMLTSKQNDIDFEVAYEAGVDDFIKKPFNQTELRCRIAVGQRIISLFKEVKVLEGLMSVCAWCKKLKDIETENWVDLEIYLQENADVNFSHGICPNCMASLKEKP